MEGHAETEAGAWKETRCVWGHHRISITDYDAGKKDEANPHDVREDSWLKMESFRETEAEGRAGLREKRGCYAQLYLRCLGMCSYC